MQRTLSPKDSLVSSVVSTLKRNGLMHRRHVLGGAVVLRSKPGCEQQMWHTDYDPDALRRKRIKPRGVIIALENDTCFVTPDKHYTLESGDVLCFDGDEIHAGAAYSKENVRLHLYLDVPNVKRALNRTWLIT